MVTARLVTVYRGVVMSYRYKGKSADKTGRLCIIIIVLAMVGIMSVQIVNLYQKNQQYIAQESDLQEQKAKELERVKELEEFSSYMQTQEYIEEIAKSKLGLIYEDEYVFKEQR